MRILQRFLNFTILAPRLCVILSLLVGTSSLVLAQTPPATPAAAPAAGSAATSSQKGPRKQTLTFEDELVEGSTQKPELFYLFQKKNFNYKRLIKLRDNFLPEMKRSTEDIQRGRSNN